MRKFGFFVVVILAADTLCAQALDGIFPKVNSSQTIVIAPRYEAATDFSEGVAAVCLDKQWGFIDRKGDWLIRPQYKNARTFHEGMAAVQTESGWGYIDREGKFIIEPRYFDAGDFGNGIAAVKIYNTDNYDESQQAWNFISKDGSKAFESISSKTFRRDGVQAARPFRKGYASIKLDGKWGAIDTNGNVVVEPQFNEPHDFSEGLIPAVGEFLEWGYTDIDGNWIINAKYRRVSDFLDGIAVVEKYGGKYNIIDTKGNELIDDSDDMPHLVGAGYISRRSDEREVELWRLGDDYTMEVSCAIIPGNRMNWVNEITYSASPDISIPINMPSVSVPEDWKLSGIHAYSDGLWRAEYQTGDDRSAGVGFVTFSMPEFLSGYIADYMSNWMKKGEYESTSAWKSRTSVAAQQEKMTALADDYMNAWLSKGIDTWKLSLYDADNGTYAVHTDFGNLVVSVPNDKAKVFKENWKNTRKQVSFIYDNGLKIDRATFEIPGQDSYAYVASEKLYYAGADLDANNKMVDVAVTVSSPIDAFDRPQISKPLKPSDVDVNIPESKSRKPNDKTFAVIIANQNYRREVPVEFAHNDGETFKAYCRKTLGIPENNIHFVADATLNDIQAEVDWLGKVGKTYGEEARLILYYAGHGIPDESTREAYLLPSDGYGSNTRTGYPLKDLYARLSEAPSVVTVFLDACFTGASRSNKKEMLASARGVAIKPKMDVPPGNLIVFSASQEDETAYPYREKGHGIFTYFLLKKLQESKGETTLGELSEYVVDRVSKVSLIDNPKNQTPSINPSALLKHKWNNLKLK